MLCCDETMQIWCYKGKKITVMIFFLSDLQAHSVACGWTSGADGVYGSGRTASDAAFAHHVPQDWVTHCRVEGKVCFWTALQFMYSSDIKYWFLYYCSLQVTVIHVWLWMLSKVGDVNSSGRLNNMLWKYCYK